VAADSVQKQIETYRGYIKSDLKEPANTYVREIVPDGLTHIEADFYAKPVKGVFASYRYLNNSEEIVNRQGAHIVGNTSINRD
jgi:hypothetical protein